MQFFRLIKPDWAKPKLVNGEDNPKFVRNVDGDDVIDVCNPSNDLIQSKNAEGYNVYFFPNKPSTDVYSNGVKFLSGKHIDDFKYLFVDMDLKDGVYPTKESFINKLNTFPLKPSMIVDSGNGIHAYWIVSDLTRDAYVHYQMALLTYFNTDESVYTVLQLMRFPGSLNTKAENNYKQSLIIEEYSSQVAYKLEEFPKLIFENLDEKAIQKAQKHLDKLDGKYKVELPDFVNIDELPEVFLDFMSKPGNAHIHNLFYDPKGATGDRSKSDLRLANILFKAGFNKKDALNVIANTQKALSKGHSRMNYAEMTIAKVYDEVAIAKYKTVGQRLRLDDVSKNLGAMIRATDFLDFKVLSAPWRKRELIGVIAGTGIGKTTFILKIIKDTIENNPENDDIHILYSLEMAEGEMIDRWIKLVGKDSPLAERLYVIGNEDEKGDPRNIGIQELYEISAEIKQLTGKQIGIMALDHIGIVSKKIDTRKKHTFDVESEPSTSRGDIRTVSVSHICKQLKPLCKMLDCLIIVLSQTTKEKGVGDLPIDKDGAYGISDYENIMDRILTIWQPLLRIHDKTNLRFLAWKYAKIRNMSRHDLIIPNSPKLLTYDLDSGNLKLSSPDEYQEFTRLYPMAKAARDNQVKKIGGEYSIQTFLDTNAEMLNRLKANNGNQ